MHIEDLTPLVIRFQKKKPDINDAVLWYKNIMEPLSVEDHPFYWPILLDNVPELLVGGLYFPYSTDTMNTFLAYCQDHHLFYENIEKFQKQGAAVQWNRSIALRLLALEQYKDFEHYYGQTSIWNHILNGMDIRNAFDVAMSTMDKPFFLWGLFPMLATYNTHEEHPKISAYDIQTYFDMIEEQYPHLTEHTEWIDVRSFHQYHDDFLERAQTLDCSIEKLHHDLLSLFMQRREQCVLPKVEAPIEQVTETNTIIYDDQIFF